MILVQVALVLCPAHLDPLDDLGNLALLDEPCPLTDQPKSAALVVAPDALVGPDALVVAPDALVVAILCLLACDPVSVGRVPIVPGRVPALTKVQLELGDLQMS